MKSASAFAVVLVTTPNRRVARTLARLALEHRLAACANLIPGVESHYWWQGRLERGNEVLIVFKTRRNRLAALERLILENHPYDTAEFITLPLASGTKRYLDWLAASVD
jgi:periplasmic divalent cation tolerance protein